MLPAAAAAPGNLSTGLSISISAKRRRCTLPHGNMAAKERKDRRDPFVFPAFLRGYFSGRNPPQSRLPPFVLLVQHGNMAAKEHKDRRDPGKTSRQGAKMQRRRRIGSGHFCDRL